MGRVAAPYGVQGWIKVRAFTAVPDGLLAYPSWWLGTSDGRWREFAVREARVHADSLVARLRGMDGREQAAQWRGALIGVPRALLPALSEGEFYLRDLVGLAVVNRSGVTLGRVEGVLDASAHPVLRVVAEGNRDEDEHLIPLVPAYIDAIDIAGGRIVVDWQSDYRP
jgi:16S rRNA processing protein RimM